jgi:small conductance mechanosensitive channel
LLGRLIAGLMRHVTKVISKRADLTRNLTLVNRLRRFETMIVLSIALIRALLVILALYFWWTYTHPNEQPTALIGASALLALILGGILSPLLRDFAFGSVMMAEHWYGVGDHVTIEPYTLQGVIERVTLRSTRIRSLSGEVIWVSNQNISAVRISPKGIHTMAVEMFVSDLERGIALLEQANLRIPTGPLMVVSPLTVMTQQKVGSHLWHLTAVGETAPERSWLLETFAVKVIKEVDEKSKDPILVQDPVVRYADNDAERRFARTIHNASKTKKQRRTISKKSGDSGNRRKA